MNPAWMSFRGAGWRCAAAIAMIWLPAEAIAQSNPSVNMPQLGYIADGDSLRQVNGIPAAAVVGKPMAGLPSLAHVAGSPDGRFAVVSERDSGAVSVYRGDSAQPSLSAIPGIGYYPDLLQLSPGGKSGIAWFSYFSRAQVITGLPDHPVWRHFDAPYLDSLPVTLAVSDDGQWAAGAWKQGVYAFGPRGEVVRMQIDEPGIALAFLPAKHDFVVATARKVLSVADPGGRAAVSTLLTADGETPPELTAVAAVSSRVVAAMRDGGLMILNSAEASILNVNCRCEIQGLIPMGIGALRLTGFKNGSFQLLDLATLDQHPDKPSIYYVSVLPEVEAASEGAAQ